MSAAPAERRAVSVEVPPAPAWWRVLPSRVLTFWTVELWRIRHDQQELVTRAIQPALWLLIFGETFTQLRAIPTGRVPYLDFMAPGIMAQSGLFVAIFYGIQIIWERDAGVLTKLLATPTPRVALVSGKAFAAGLRAAVQAVIVFVLSAILRVGLVWNPLHLAAALVIVVLGAAFFSLLSVTIAGVVLSRERLMGIGQAITMPLFFASNALYPVRLMPGWLQALSAINPLSYEVDALRSLLIGTPGHLVTDVAVLVAATAVAISVSAALLGRLAQ
jgi:ABC-2 type transport system permease protein